MKNQIKLGSVMAYINIFLSMVVSVFLTPMLIRGLGDAEYGVYKIIQSFSAQLGIMSFGIATLISRNIVYYNAKKQETEKENFLFMAYIITAVLALLVAVVGSVLYASIDALYSKSLSSEQLILAKKLFIVLIANVSLSIICDSVTGLMRSHEKFIAFNGFKMLRQVLRIILIIILINICIKSFGIVVADLSITIIILLVSILYNAVAVKEKARFHYFDRTLLLNCFSFSFAVFLQAIVNQVNNNVDNIILGAMKGANVVTVYSIALSFYGVFISIVDVVRGLFGPRATRLVANGATADELTVFAIGPARIQAMIAGLGIVGFILIGKEFIFLWLGNGFEDVYIITLILIVPAMIPMAESITYEILDALMKRLGRSLILLCMCGVNILISILFINTFGYIGAALGTAFSLIIGDGLLMNFYLYKKIGLNIPKLFKGVFIGMVIPVITTLLIGQVIVRIPVPGWGGISIKAVLIVIVYFGISYFKGMNSSEKNFVRNEYSRIFHKR